MDRQLVLVLIIILTVQWISYAFGFAYSRSSAYRHVLAEMPSCIWVVELATVNNQSIASKVAVELGLTNLGSIGNPLKNHFLFAHPNSIDTEHESSIEFLKHETEDRLKFHPAIRWFEEQVFKTRVKRSLYLPDPRFPDQWHLRNNVTHGMDINVTGVWEYNVTGIGVTVGVIDDGLEWSNPDLRENYSEAGSWDLIDDDQDPSPVKAASSNKTSKNEHGTRCAGEIAAVSNSVCGVGVAYRARVSGVKILNGKMTDSMEAIAFNKNMDINDIYSCSWGPEDDGKTVDGPHTLAKRALEHGVDAGRKGYGTIYVVASGNGGLREDNCNFDGYANSIYTITIGAVDEKGKMPYYGEECAAMIAVSFSSGQAGGRSIVTTDWTETDHTGCTSHHTGTSAAAPLAAGMIALMLQVRPCLTWRDIQYLIILTAVKVDVDHSAWYRNSVGLDHSHQHGFGLMNAWRLVNAALVWKPVPFKVIFASKVFEPAAKLSPSAKIVVLNYNLTSTNLLPYHLNILEYVQVKVTIEHSVRGNLEIRISCPSGAESVIAAPRPEDASRFGFTDWTFSTVRCWGEKPVGMWTLTVEDTVKNSTAIGLVRSWQLILHGTLMTSQDLQERRRLVEESYSGKYLKDPSSASNLSECEPPPISMNVVVPLSLKTLKILAISSIFLFVLGVYQTLEYLWCYDEEKRKTAETIRILKPNNHRLPPSSFPKSSGSSSSDTIPLLPVTSDFNGRTYGDDDDVDVESVGDDVQCVDVESVDDDHGGGDNCRLNVTTRT